MKKLIFLLLLLLIATPCFAQQQEARMSLGVIGGSVPAAGGGPDVWYYSCTDTPLVEPTTTIFTGDTFGAGDYCYCAEVIVSTGGSATKLAIKKSDTDSANIKMAIYDTSGNRLDAGTCTVATSSAGWVECTKDTPYTISVSTVRVCFNGDAVITMDQSSKQAPTDSPDAHGQCSLSAYATFPAAAYTFSDYNGHCYGVRVYVD